MAREILDRAAGLRRVREFSREPGAIEAAEQLLRTSSGTPRVFESGWRRCEGVLVLGPHVEPDQDRPARLEASNERALRDLLLAIPRGERVRLQFGADWHLPAVAELLEGGPPEGARCFAGVKRGTAALGPPGGDRLLGKQDALVQLLRALAQPEGRERLGRFVAEGPTLVGRAIDDGLPVEAIVHRSAGGELIDRARAAGVATWRASDGLLGTLTPTRPLPEVLAAVHLRLRDAAGRAPFRASVVLVAENLQNPDNLGMVLRTADAAGAEAVVVAGETTDPLHRNCVRAARGAVGRIPIFRSADLPRWVAALRGEGFQVLGATGHGEASLYESALTPPAAIIVGNEESGISPQTLAACSARVAIPMAPGQDSLNVGVAAGVMLFELVRRRDTI